jgi:osmotically-inducible protein OsmY
MNRFEEELQQRAGIRATVEEREWAVVIKGSIGSARQHQQALDIVSALAPTKNIVDELQVTEGAQANPPPGVPGHRGDVIGTFGMGGMDNKWDLKEPAENFGDEAIADAVRHLLREDPGTNQLDLHVAVQRGRVQLQGMVPYAKDVTKASQIASRAPGVREVLTDLKVTNY